MRKISLILIIALFSGLASAAPLTLFFTNDTHGAYLPSTYRTVDGNVSLGGYENLYNLISAQRDTLKNTLWLDAGDQQTGSIFSSLVHNQAIGGAVIEAFNKMGLNGATFGNHEFDQSLQNTLHLAKLAKFPFISTNVVYKKNGKSITRTPYKIFKRGKLRIGVMGLTLTDLREKVKIENVEELTILPYKQAIDKHINKLDNKTDLIILLTHNGFEADSLLATQLDDRIDLIVGGHTHTVTEKPRLVNGIYIVQTGAFLINYGRLDLEVSSDRISNNLLDEVCLFPVETTSAKTETEFSRFLQTTISAIDKDMGRVIGYTEVDWIPDKFKTSAVSRWQVEALYREYLEQLKPDVAIINNGGIRKAIAAGEITLRDMTELLPFTNYIVAFSCYGRDFQPMIEHNLKLMQTREHDIVQTHNLSWQVIEIEDGEQVTDIRVKDEPVLPDKIYRIVSHDYILGQADKYLMFKPFDTLETGDLILDAMLRQVEKQLGKKKL